MMASSPKEISKLDLRSPMVSLKLIDDQVYRNMVLHLPLDQTEESLDEQLQQESRALGITPLQVNVENERMNSSRSGTTIQSNSDKQASLLSSSTAPTSCSSSEYRPLTQSSMQTTNPIPTSEAPSLISETQRKRSSVFRTSLRNKMAGLKRRKSPTTPTRDNLCSEVILSPESDKTSVKSGMKSPGSIKSSQSSWSSPVSAAKSSYESAPSPDQEALRRSTECPELLNLQIQQMAERARFLDFERHLLNELHTRRDLIKDQKTLAHREVLNEQQTKIEKAVEELEVRQLEDELRLQKEHATEKRHVVTRLRHMEAYCQNPTPPPTPVDSTSGRPSLDATLPERKVTDRDYHNLAQQYRERDAMDSLHTSKINVLRGKQKRAVENLMRKKELEIENLELEQEKELQEINDDFAGQEKNLRLALAAKRVRLELRWRTQTLIEQTTVERATGLKYALLPAVTASVSSTITT